MGVPAALISTSPRREDTIVRRNPREQCAVELAFWALPLVSRPAPRHDWALRLGAPVGVSARQPQPLFFLISSNFGVK